ncbi:hypothetical protein MARINON1_50216 [Marinobacter salarius]|nr:hypothetical protein MARINON1_50216 [Marinobacter salarius]
MCKFLGPLMRISFRAPSEVELHYFVLFANRMWAQYVQRMEVLSVTVLTSLGGDFPLVTAYPHRLAGFVPNCRGEGRGAV